MPGGDDVEFGAGGRPIKGNDYSSSSAAYLIEETEIQWTSWLVPMFVVANVAVFVAAMYINDCPKHYHSRLEGGCVARFLGRFSFEPTRDNPLFGPSSSTLEKMGAVEWEKIVKRHQGWRMVTCIWLHAGVIHLVANMLSLVFIGVRLEQQFGFVRVGIIYLVSGFGGSVLSSLFIRSGISVGASAMITLLVIIAVNLAIGILPHVDNFAHIGGFLTGFLLGFILLPRPQFSWMERRNLPSGVRLKSKYKPYQYVLWVISLALLISGFAVALVMLFRGVNGHEKCHWCKYLSCVPTSKWECDDF
ncbi:RHOMBOID-like protein 3 [Linum perenne]